MAFDHCEIARALSTSCGPIDVPLALSLTILLVMVVAFANMLTDVLHSFADPRVDVTR